MLPGVARHIERRYVHSRLLWQVLLQLGILGGLVSVLVPHLLPYGGIGILEVLYRLLVLPHDREHTVVGLIIGASRLRLEPLYKRHPRRQLLATVTDRVLADPPGVLTRDV